MKEYKEQLIEHLDKEKMERIINKIHEIGKSEAVGNGEFFLILSLMQQMLIETADQSTAQSLRDVVINLMEL